jgi:hypothetical protein
MERNPAENNPLPKNEAEVNDYLLHMHEEVELPDDPAKRAAEQRAGVVDKDELFAASQYKLRTGDKRSAKEIALDWRNNPEKKVA